MDKVKRINVHLGENQIAYIDALVAEINGASRYNGITRAEVIRWALEAGLGAPGCSTVYWDKQVGAKINKVLAARRITAKQTDKKRGA